jgi:hypothetical protein
VEEEHDKAQPSITGRCTHNLSAHISDGTMIMTFDSIPMQRSLILLGLLAVIVLWSKALAIRRAFKAIP